MKESIEDQLKRSARQVAESLAKLHSRARDFTSNPSIAYNAENLAEAAVEFTELIRKLHGRKPL